MRVCRYSVNQHALRLADSSISEACLRTDIKQAEEEEGPRSTQLLIGSDLLRYSENENTPDPVIKIDLVTKGNKTNMLNYQSTCF